METDRRRFLRDLGVGVLGAAVYDGILQGLKPDNWNTLSQLARSEPVAFHDRLQTENFKLAKTLFGDRGDVLKIAGGRAHYQYPNAMHPDDRWACESIVQYARQLAENYRYEEEYELSSRGSFVCTGSPVSNAWSRLFLEYAYLNPSKPDHGLVRSEAAIFRLPFSFELRRQSIRQNSKQRFHVAEAGRRVLNWSIRSSSGYILSPNTEQKQSDFLLISRIPNWREQRGRYKDFRNTVTIFSGTHGVGTAAVRLLFTDTDLLKKVILKTSQYEFWQLLLTVEGMESARHPYSSQKRLIARSISHSFQCEPVNI